VQCNLLHFLCNVWEKIVFAEMYNKSVSVNGSKLLISYVNVVVLIIKIPIIKI
jgi:hypothetical protein